MVCLVLLDRLVLLMQFGWKYTDHDQTLMWFGAKEMWNGRFHEPHFYGQAYNSMLEAFLAIPLLSLGLDYPVALPIITSILCLLPFFLLSNYAKRKWKPISASLILLVPLLLRTEYGMITSMPRGFVTGLAVAGIAFYILSRYSSKISLFATGFIIGFAGWLNPNCAPFILSFLILVIGFEKGIFKKTLFIGTGLIAFAPIWWWSSNFYKTQPEYLVTKGLNLSFDLNNYLKTIYSWPDYFGSISPLDGGIGIFIFLAIATLIYHFFLARDYAAILALAAGTLILLLGMGIGKAHDGFNNVFYPLSRMGLALPLVFALGLSRLSLSSKFIPFIGFARIIGFVLHLLQLGYTVNDQVSSAQEELVGIIYVEEIAELKTNCTNILAASDSYSLILMDWEMLPLVYGCPCVENDFPSTWLPSGDRRTWLKQWLTPISDTWPPFEDPLQTDPNQQIGEYLKKNGYSRRN
ncbi:MAG: hypothetical protein ACI959_000240 [Limisphaerales bacterium]|jgi:hypothetical protein